MFDLPVLKISVAVLSLVCSWPGSFCPEKACSDRDRLQGTWAVTRVERDGKSRDSGDFIQQEYAFDGDRFVERIHGCGVLELEGTYHLESTAQPRAIDLNFRSDKSKGRVLKGIYVFEGKKLKICYSNDGERPTEFRGGKGQTLLFLVKEA